MPTNSLGLADHYPPQARYLQRRTGRGVRRLHGTPRRVSTARPPTTPRRPPRTFDFVPKNPPPTIQSVMKSNDSRSRPFTLRYQNHRTSHRILRLKVDVPDRAAAPNGVRDEQGSEFQRILSMNELRQSRYSGRHQR